MTISATQSLWPALWTVLFPWNEFHFIGCLGRGLCIPDDAQMVTVHCWERSLWKVDISNVMLKLTRPEHFIHFSYSHMNAPRSQCSKLHEEVSTLPVTFTRRRLHGCWELSCPGPQPWPWNAAVRILLPTKTDVCLVYLTLKKYIEYFVFQNRKFCFH